MVNLNYNEIVKLKWSFYCRNYQKGAKDQLFG